MYFDIQQQFEKQPSLKTLKLKRINYNSKIKRNSRSTMKQIREEFMTLHE